MSSISPSELWNLSCKAGDGRCDEPFVGVGLEVLFEPREHGAAWLPARGHGIETNKMDVGVIERVITLRARGDAAGLTRGGQGEDVFVRKAPIESGAIDSWLPMVGQMAVFCRMSEYTSKNWPGTLRPCRSHRRCRRARSRHRRDGWLRSVIGIAHAEVGCLPRAMRATIADEPHADGVRRPRRGSRAPRKLCAGRERAIKRTDLVEILGVRGKAREGHFVFGG